MQTLSIIHQYTPFHFYHEAESIFHPLEGIVHWSTVRNLMEIQLGVSCLQFPNLKSYCTQQLIHFGRNCLLVFN